MRKLAIIVAAFLTAAVLICPAGAAEKKYTFGFSTGLNPTINAQLKTSFTDILKIISAREKVVFTTEFYPDGAKLEAAAKKGKIDFLLTDSNTTLELAVKKLGFIPFSAYSMYGKKTLKYCIYTKNPDFKSVADLKGASLGAYRYSDMYYFLRKLTNAQPEKYYKLKQLNDNTAPFYVLTLNQAEAIFTMNYSYDYGVLTNPASVKGVREVACSQPTYMPPLMYRKGTPADVVEMLRKTLANARTDPSFKKYLPLLKMVKLEYFPVTQKEIAPGIDMVETAVKNGWNRDYEKWVAETKEVEKTAE
ncbi:MAG TPA: PhnD/SsuA/transferrin family substrate-binding protein [bacterium]|nr:PhnD/SsuA/transferrin family substrate-binding protein [bacterium]